MESLQQEYGKFLAHQNEMRSLNSVIKSLEDAIALKKETVADIEEDKRKADEVELHKRDISLYHSFSKKLEEQMVEIKAKEDEEDKLEKAREAERKNLAKLNFDILNIKNKISNLETDLEHYKQEDGHEDNCPFCGAVLSDEKKAEIEEAATYILYTREPYLTMGKTLADLYDPDTMPEDLKSAHERLDDIVESCYPGYPFATDEARLECLFKMYEKMTAKK